MMIAIEYKNGTTIKQDIHYVASDGTYLIFSVKKNPSPVWDEPVRVPLKNIKAWTTI